MNIDPSKITTTISLIALALISITTIVITYLRSPKNRGQKVKFNSIFYICCIILLSAFGYLMFTNYTGVNENNKLEKAILKSNQALFNYISSTSEGDNKAFSTIQESIDLYPCYENLIIQATLFKQKGDFNGALAAVSNAKKFKETKALFILQGEIYRGLDSLEQSLESYTRAINLKENISNKNILDGLAYFNSSGILLDKYNLIKNAAIKDSLKKKLLYFADKGVGLLIQSNYKSMCNIYVKRAEMFMITQDLINAEDFYKKAIVCFENDLNSKIESRYLAETYNNYSNLLYEQQEYKKSIEMAEKTKTISLNRGDNEMLAYAYYNIGDSYLKLKLKLKSCENFNLAQKFFHLSGKSELESKVRNIILINCN